MDDRFLVHNSHLDGVEAYSDRDPQLRRLKSQIYVHHPDLLHKLPTKIPGVYTLGGGRQIGKTTLIKQWILSLLHQGVDPKSIVFLSGELIDDHHSLLHLVSQLEKVRFLIIDEVTYIKNWDKTVKYLADSGSLDEVILMLSGSDLVMIREAMKRFPGRRGKSDQVDFHLYPLSFREAVLLRNPELDIQNPSIERLFEEFENYLIHGGFLTAINDFYLEGQIKQSTYLTYSDWIRGDMLKRGKKEHYLIEVLTCIYKRYGSQVSWNSLSKDLSIDHPSTVSDYCHALEMMDVLFVQSALIEDKLVAAPKKPKKIYFSDPFISHAVRNWLKIREEIEVSNLVESCAVTHFRRFYPTFYIKSEGEVDIAYLDQNRFWPVEVKWRSRHREKDLKQIKKYSEGLILTKLKTTGFIDACSSMPLPLKLFQLQ